MPSNLPVTLLLVGGGGLLVWAGIANPEGGLWAELGRVLDGAPSKLKGAPAAQYVAPVMVADTAQRPGESPADYFGRLGQQMGGNGAELVAAARTQLGKPYQWGGTGPDRWDCSGLVQWAAKRVGVTLPRTAALQQTRGQAVPGIGQAVPGDLVFYGWPAHHVAIYAGNGRIVHAPYTGTVVREEAVTGPGAVANVRRIV